MAAWGRLHWVGWRGLTKPAPFVSLLSRFLWAGGCPRARWAPPGCTNSSEHQQQGGSKGTQRGCPSSVVLSTLVRGSDASRPRCERGSRGSGGYCQIQENKGAMALKFTQRSKKIMGSFIRIAVVLDHIVNDLFNLNIFHKESPYFHKYVIST